MNKLQKAGCIGALVAGMLTPAYTQQTSSYDLKQETAVQQDKMDDERFKLWAYVSIAGMALLFGTAIAYAKQRDDINS